MLDGANRSTAAKAAGFPHMVVQVVTYDERHVRLTTWNHALSSYPHGELEPALGRIAGLKCARTDRLHARAMLRAPRGAGVDPLRRRRGARLQGGADLTSATRCSTRWSTPIASTGASTASRAAGCARRAAAAPTSRRSRCSALRARRDPGAGEDGRPATRGHRTSSRALARAHQRADRAAGRHEALLDSKNEWLAEWVRERLAMRQVRYYEEPTVLFDE